MVRGDNVVTEGKREINSGMNPYLTKSVLRYEIAEYQQIVSYRLTCCIHQFENITRGLAIGREKG
jgi:hypothetical protein